MLALATWGGVGLLPGAPGTWGTLAALPLWWGFGAPGSLGRRPGDDGGYPGGPVGGPAQDYLGQADHPAIVIDEVAGLLITLAGAPLSWAAAGIGFILFRTLDILKSPPIRWFTSGESGGLEVMVDDVVAGELARLILEIVYAFEILPG